MSKLLDISSYSPSEGEKFFFDTNVWLHLFCPIGSYSKDTIEKYNMFFKKIKMKKACIHTSSLVISEFFNAYVKIEFKIKQELEPNKYVDYKRDFRSTPEYEELSCDICELIKNKILKNSIRLNDEFTTLDVDKILECSTSYDFNDNYYAQLCRLHKIKIVSNDKDFIHSFNDVDIISKWK